MFYRNCSLLLTGALMIFPVQSYAKNYALLVGVSAYPALEKSLQLQGPQNDVVLGKLLLKDVGFADENIRVLANGVPSANGEPTRLGILGELDALAKKAQRGDYVYLQFGGHGSQQPARADKVPKEQDGLDEIFLPVDVGKWDGSVGSIKNALRDDELGQKLDAIRAKGAFVWAVFDACHSGNITRGGEDGETRQRRADPLALGIPEALMRQAENDRVQTRGKAEPEESALGSRGKAEGGYVFFYAAQTTETTPESRFPAGEADRKPYGVFTYTLAQVIQSNPGISYRQAGERVLQLYAARNVRVTPLFEGSALDAPVFGQAVGDVVRQWHVSKDATGLTMKAGALQQMGAGAILAVFPDAAAKKEAEPLGYMRADKVEVMQSQISPVAYNGKAATFTIPNDAVVRLVNPNVNFNLRVALPPSTPKGEAYALAKKVIDKLKSGGREGLKVEWVEASKPADIRLMLSDDREQLQDKATGLPQLWLVSADGAWIKSGAAKTASIKLDKSEQEIQDVLSGELLSIGKAINLVKISTTSGGGLVGSSKLETEFFVTHAPSTELVKVEDATIPSIGVGDKMQITIKNMGIKDVDITVLGIDALYGVSLLYPVTSNDVNRVHPHDKVIVPDIELDGTTAGRESILVIAVEAEQNSPTVNLGFLQQPPLQRTRGGTRSGGADPVSDLFKDAGFGDGEATRGTVRRGIAGDKTIIKVYQYKASANP